MKQLEPTKNNLLALAAIALATLGMAACGGGSQAQASEHKEPEPAAPTVHYGTLDQASSSQAVPRHLSPRPGAEVNDTVPTFVWAGVSGASGFEIQVSDDTRFPDSRTIRSGVVRGPPWVSTEDLEPGKTYYWRIRAVFQSSTRGPWSDYSPFSLAAGLAPSPAGPTPTDNGITITNGERGAVLANLTVWDAASQVLMTTPGKDLESVLKSLEPGRVYQFAATLDMLIVPRDFGIDRAAIHLAGGKPQLVFW